METIFNRYIGILILFFLLCFWIVEPSYARNNESVLIAVAGARKAGVPEETVSGILARGYEYHLRAEEIIGFLAVIRTAHENGSPLGPLMGKIEEGLAKHIEVRTISKVLHQELERFQFTRQTAIQTLNRWKGQEGDVRPDDVARMAGTLAMGLSRSDMQTFFTGVPQAPMYQIANALEFMAGLVQAGMDRDEARHVVYTGIGSNFFSDTDWRLSTMVRAAMQKNISKEKVATAAMDVVKGKMEVSEAIKRLNLDPTDLQRGPYVGGPPEAPSGQPGGHGQAGGPGGDSGSSGPGGSSDTGGSGSGQESGSHGNGMEGPGGSEGSSGGSNR
jgi:hypothetical protein